MLSKIDRSPIPDRLLTNSGGNAVNRHGVDRHVQIKTKPPQTLTERLLEAPSKLVSAARENVTRVRKDPRILLKWLRKFRMFAVALRLVDVEFEDVEQLVVELLLLVELALFFRAPKPGKAHIRRDKGVGGLSVEGRSTRSRPAKTR